MLSAYLIKPSRLIVSLESGLRRVVVARREDVDRHTVVHQRLHLRRKPHHAIVALPPKRMRRGRERIADVPVERGHTNWVARRKVGSARANDKGKVTLQQVEEVGTVLLVLRDEQTEQE